MSPPPATGTLSTLADFEFATVTAPPDFSVSAGDHIALESIGDPALFDLSDVYLVGFVATTPEATVIMVILDPRFAALQLYEFPLTLRIARDEEVFHTSLVYRGTAVGTTGTTSLFLSTDAFVIPGTLLVIMDTETDAREIFGLWSVGPVIPRYFVGISRLGGPALTTPIDSSIEFRLATPEEIAASGVFMDVMVNVNGGGALYHSFYRLRGGVLLGEEVTVVEEDASRLEGAAGFSLIGERFTFTAYRQGIDLVYNAKSVGEWGPLANPLLASSEVALRIFYG